MIMDLEKNMEKKNEINIYFWDKNDEINLIITFYHKKL
jgi:hypothetical protein